ncbi:MAG TPA: DUF4270 family protein [Chitinophagaceae bacterium]|nr:hypothetical protein [Chitinophagaceae bacterium]MCB9055661.1 hypothetical protein [Chitinophagales bacterium]HPG11294.1 DUF4270 family protein [Chitinophagaceae bacterium]
MKISKFYYFFVSLTLAVLLIFSSCRKINEATELGGGLIPPIDYIHTFDTLINTLAYNDSFGLVNDSLRLGKNDEYFLGLISNDPIMGKTNAKVFFELKPFYYPFTFGNTNPDSLYLDSVVLVMSYVETYGDTNALQQVNVFEVDNNLPANNFRPDSLYLVRESGVTYSNLLGTRMFTPSVLDDSVFAFRDTTAGQLRIKLNNSFGQRLLEYDSTSNIITGAYANDSVFRSKFRGFALESVSGNALMGFDLADTAKTKLAIYYRYKKNGITDTTVTYFKFNSDGNDFTGAFDLSHYSAAANHVTRDYSGTPFMASLSNGTASDQNLFIQNNPGTYTIIKIPDLANVSNRALYRAELIAEQDYDPSDNLFAPPSLMYLDAFDDSVTSNFKFRTVPYDLLFDINGNANLVDFGSVPYTETDLSGNPIKVWKFNITRYIQNYLTGELPLYDFRLSSPVVIKENYAVPPSTDQVLSVYVNPSIAKGRVRLIGSTGAGDTNPRRLRLRLIYSRL